MVKVTNATKSKPNHGNESRKHTRAGSTRGEEAHEGRKQTKDGKLRVKVRRRRKVGGTNGRSRGRARS